MRSSRRRFLWGGLAAGAAAGAAATSKPLYFDHEDVAARRRLAFDQIGTPHRFARGERIELHNALFADIVRGSYMPAGTRVIVRGGKIEAVSGPAGQTESPPADRQIDLKGRTVVPGLFNTHCHVQNVNPRLPSGLQDALGNVWATNLYHSWQVTATMIDCIAHGITNVRDTWSEDLDANRRLRERIGAGEFPGPRIRQCVLVSPMGGVFAPERGIMDRVMWRSMGLPTIDYARRNSGVLTFRPDAPEAEVRDTVNRAIDERGAEYLKIYDQRTKRLTTDVPGVVMYTQEQLNWIVDQGRKRGVRTTVHHITVECFRRGVKAGVHSLAHLPFDEPLRDGDIDAFLRAGCTLEPTASIVSSFVKPVPGDPMDHPRFAAIERFRAQRAARIREEYWIPQLQSTVAAGVRSVDQGLGPQAMQMLKPWMKAASIGLDNVARIYSNGGTLACGNDGGAMPSTPAMIREELEMLQLGFEGNSKPRGSQLLRMATIDSAIALGLEDQFGTIEAGKIADLVVMDADPLENPSALGSLAAAVFLGGDLVVNRCGINPVVGNA